MLAESDELDDEELDLLDSQDGDREVAFCEPGMVLFFC